MDDFETCFARVKAETNIKNLSDLADMIGRRQPTISENRKKGTFLPQWAYELEIKTGLTTRWIMTGEGPKRFGGRDIQGNTETPQAIMDIPSCILDLAAWAKDFAGSGNNFDWLENLLDTCLPPFKTWKEQRKSGAEAPLHQDQITRKVA